MDTETSGSSCSGTLLKKDILHQLNTCICESDMRRARELIRALRDQDYRTNSGTEDNAERFTESVLHKLLCTAVESANAEFVRFLVDECGANAKSPVLLCNAAQNARLEVVQVLVQYGADVNAECKTYGSHTTALMLACHRRESTAKIKGDVVRCLIEGGANVNQTGKDGLTCLMKAMWSLEICQLLVEAGASVNAVDVEGNTALHCATNKALETVRLLLQHGADPFICNKSGDDALQMAAVAGHTRVLSCLIFESKPRARRCADLYALVGANYAGMLHSRKKTLQFFTKSITIQSQCKPACVARPSPSPAYKNAVEVRDVGSLTAISDDPEALRIQGQLMRERILGPGHSHTVLGAFTLAHYYKQQHSFQRAVDVAKHALFGYSCTPAQKSPSAKFPDVPAKVCELFEQLFVDGFSLRFADVVEVAKKMASVLKQAASVANDRRPMHAMPRGSLYLVYILCWYTGDAEKRAVRELLREFVKLRTSDGQTLLHLAAGSVHTRYRERRTDQPGVATVVSELLAAGAAVNAMDSRRDSPLHLVLRDPRVRKHSPLELYQPLPGLNHQPAGYNQLPAALNQEPHALNHQQQGLNQQPFGLNHEPMGPYHQEEEGSEDGSSELGENDAHWPDYGHYDDSDSDDELEDWSPVVELLLKHGAHIDQRNSAGTTPADSLQAHTVDTFDYVTLQCLAARVVRRHNLTYRDVVPAVLHHFVDMH